MQASALGSGVSCGKNVSSIGFPFPLNSGMCWTWCTKIKALNAGSDIDDSNMSIFDVKEGLFGPLSH